jgi:phosphohistidine swiveling domain-containing protein
MTELGPKAESLRALATAGLPVPEARFLDCDAYREHAERAGVASLLRSHAPLDAAAVHAAIVATPLSPDVRTLLLAWHGELGRAHLAVRSSANAEDLPHASFAGQHGTFFVTGSGDLPDRVRDCWASLFSERAVNYRERNGVPHDGVAMAVIVQRLVPALAAGVAFTVDPVDGSPDVIVEACLGIGETLVSGRVTPDRFVFGREALALRLTMLGEKPVRLAVDGDRAVVTQTVPADEAVAPSVSEDVARDVARLALRAEELVGGPADVEWAFDGERVWLLQARPVTTVGVPKAAKARVPAASAETSTIWSNVNTGEILPDVATPMTWSIIHGHADDILGGMLGAFGVPFDAKRIIGLVGGRIYFNLTLLRETFRTIPGVDPDVALGGMHDYVELPPLDSTEPSFGARAWAVLRMATVMPGYVGRHTPSRAARFAADMRATTEAGMRRIEAAHDKDEALRVMHSLNGEFSEFNDALAYMGVAMFGFGLLGGLTNRWLGDTTGALANRLVAGRGEVASAEAGHEMWRLSALARDARAVRSAVLVGAGWADVRERLEAAAGDGDADASAFLEAWDAFMTEHGHHRRGELEFANPTWAETPDYVLGVVRSYLNEGRGSDPLAAYGERSASADLAVDESLARLGSPLKRAAFRRVLGWGRASARTRENVKSEAVRWLVAIRHALLALGERMVAAGALDRADDVFYLDYDELPALVSGEAGDWRGLVATRRAEHVRLERLSPPPVVVGPWDESSGAWAVDTDAHVLKGISVSAGVARGPARVFTSVDTDEPVLPGEILVAPFTDPGWTPYFVPAAGIVMDMGGLLSHGSIIAREYGIPAVVNVGPATRIIRTGQIIEVDGDAGEVRIIG